MFEITIEVKLFLLFFTPWEVYKRIFENSVDENIFSDNTCKRQMFFLEFQLDMNRSGKSGKIFMISILVHYRVHLTLPISLSLPPFSKKKERDKEEQKRDMGNMGGLTQYPVAVLDNYSSMFQKQIRDKITAIMDASLIAAELFC